jgi:hypothetical protein
MRPRGTRTRFDPNVRGFIRRDWTPQAVPLVSRGNRIEIARLLRERRDQQHGGV